MQKTQYVRRSRGEGGVRSHATAYRSEDSKQGMLDRGRLRGIHLPPFSATNKVA